MGSPRIRIGILGSALAAGAILLLLLFHPRLAPVRQGLLALRRHASAAGSPPAQRADNPAAPEERSHLADELAAPSGDVHTDLAAINEIFAAYRGSVHGLDPVGENSEITAALTGHNRLGFAFVPADCPALNLRGELCDRWGTPYFFHQVAGDRMEIRSAGPDRQLWTEDDVVLTP